MHRALFTALVVVSVHAFSEPASAQVLGTFRWQFAPYCNVMSVLVEQKGSVYELTGTDDGCDGAAPAASANGSAHLNASGTAGGSVSIVRPDGFVVINAITITPATLGGTWRDDWGNSGTLVFNPPSPAGGPARPLTMRGDYSGVDTAAGLGSLLYTMIAFPRSLNAAPVPHVVTFGSAPTAECPGSPTNPVAAPGHLCLYERVRASVSGTFFINPANATMGATPQGVTMGVSSSGAGNYGLYGRWAVTVP